MGIKNRKGKNCGQNKEKKKEKMENMIEKQKDGHKDCVLHKEKERKNMKVERKGNTDEIPFLEERKKKIERVENLEKK